MSTLVNNITSLPFREGLGLGSLRLLILCLSLAVFGVTDAWGDKSFKAQVGVAKGEGTASVFITKEKKGTSPENTGAEASSTGSLKSTTEYTISGWIVVDRYYKFSATNSTGYTFKGWATSSTATSYSKTDASFSEEGNGTKTYYAYFTPNTNTAYTVKHYKQNLAGTGYDLIETENLTGTTDTKVTPARKSYTGFTAPAGQEVNIDGDGSRVVEYHYTRNSYKLTWAGIDGATLSGGTPAGQVKYEATLTAPTVSKAGSQFNGWSPSVPSTMPAENVTYTAQWVDRLPTSFSDATTTTLKVGETATATVENVSDGTPVVVDAHGTEEFYAIEDPKNSVTITRSGNTLSFTPVRDETLKVTLVQVQTETVTGAEKTYTFNVSKNQTSLSLSTNSCTLDVDAMQDVTITTNNSDVTVGVTSSNPAVAEWDATNKRIVAKSAGSTTLTFTQEESEKWTKATATVSVTVKLVDNTLTVPSAKTMTVNDTWSNVLSDKNSNAELVVSNTNSDVATYDATSNTITAKKAGKATFTFSQAATAKYAATEKTITVTVNKKSNAISVTLNGSATTSTQMYYSSGITAVVTSNNTDKPILYEQTEGSTIATYYPDNNAIYSLAAAGTAKWRFWQEEDDVYSAATEVVVTVNVIKPEHNVPFTYNSELYGDNKFTIKKEGTTSYEDNRLVLGSYVWPGGWDDKYVDILFDGMPDTLTFSFQTAGAASQTQVEWYVQEGTSQATLSDKPFTATSSSGDAKVGLQSSTRCIRVCYSGNYSGRITNLKVTEKHYLEEAEPKTSQANPYDFGAEALGADDDIESFNVNWANIAPVTVTSSDPIHFSVTPSGFAQYGELGSQSINVTYRRSKDIAKHSATITITNGTYTQDIYVKGETTKKSLAFEWNTALSSTGYVMNVGEAYPSTDITYIAKLALEDEDAKVTFSSSNPSAIEVSEDGKTIHAIGAGTSEITANYPGSDQYNETSSTKTFTVDNKLKQTITWNQNLMGLKWGDKPIDLLATASSGGTITYSIQEGSAACVTLSGTNNATLNISTTVSGEAYIIATQAGGKIEGQDYFPITMTKRVIVRNPALQCEEYALGGESCTFANNLNNPKEFDLLGTPETLLTFSAYHDRYTGSWSTLHTYGALLIDEYAYINEQWQWVNIFNEVVNQGSYKDYSASVDASATKIRVRSSEEVDHHVSDLSIKRAKYMTSSVESLTGAIDINTLYSKQIKINHSNIDVMTVSVNGNFNESNLSTSTLGDGCGSYGEDAFTFSFTPTQAKTYKGTITISDGKADETKVEIPIELTAQAISQTIIDFTSEAETHWTTDNVTFNGSVPSGNQVYYTSSDETVATIDGNKLNILKSGTVTITAHCDAEDAYAAAPEIAKVITINKAIPTITTNPTAGVCYRPCTLNKVTLSGGEASVAGTFQWMNINEEVKVGTNNYNAKFIPQDQVKYAIVENIAISVTPSFKDQTITWNPAATYYGCETIAADAEASSELTVSYSSDNSGVISAEQVTNGQWTITIKSPGTATITVSQAGNETYAAATPISKTIEVKKCEPVTIEGTITASDILVGTALSTSTLNTTNAKAYFSYNSTKVEVPGSFAWENPAEILDKYDTYTRTVKFTPSNTALYGEATTTASVTATVHQIKFVEPLPEYNVNAGQKLNTATLVSGSSKLQARSVGDAVIPADQSVEAESIEWKNGDEVINTAEAVITRELIFTPKESHFSPKNAQITVHVIKQTPTITWAEDEITLTAGQTLNANAATYLTSCSANVEGTFTWENGTNQVLYSQNGSKVKVIFTPNDVAYYTVTKEVTLHVNKATRTIEWNQPELASVAVNADPITLTASISGPAITGVTDQVQYASSDEEKATIVNGQLVVHCVTTTPITITALVPENENFVTTPSKQVSVSITSLQPTLHPTATAITFGQALSASSLILDGADTPGTIAWKDGSIVPSAAGTYKGIAVFTPADPCSYSASVDVQVDVTVNQYQPTIVWTGEESYPASATGDVDLQLFKITPADLQSALTFTTSDATIATIVNGKIHCNKRGSVTITANYAGNANYKSAKKEQQITFVGMADEFTWNDGNALHFFANSLIPSTVAKAKSGLKVTYTSSDPSIVLVADNKQDMKALIQGEVSITARTEGDIYVEPIEEMVTFTIDYCSQRIEMDTKALRRFVLNGDGSVTGSPLTLSAVVYDSTGNVILNRNVQFELTSHTISSLTGNVLTVTDAGTDNLKVFVPSDGVYGYSEIANIDIVCRKIGEKCNSEPYQQGETITFNTSNPKTISFNARPCKHVTFNIKHTSQIFDTKPCEVKLISTDGTSLVLYSGTAKQDGTDESVDYLVPEGNLALYNRIECTTGANVYYTISNLTVYQRDYLKTDTKEITRTAASSNAIKVNVPYSQDIVMSYSDIPVIQYSITDNSGANLTLAPKTQGDEPEDACDRAAGTYTFTLSGFWDKIPSTIFNETITFWTSAGDKVDIPVTIEVEAGVTYTSTTGGDWNDNTIWKVGGSSTPAAPPSSSSLVEIHAPVTINEGVAEAYMVNIHNTEYENGSLTIGPKGGLRVYAGGFYNPNPNTLTIESTEQNQGYLLVSPLATKESLQASVQLATKSTLDSGADKDATWQYVGIPTTEQSFTVDYITWWYKWDEAQGWVDYKDKSDRDGSVKLKAWEGYAITQYGKPVYTWQGGLIRDDVDIPLTRTSSGMQGDNLFANSYSAPIDVKQFTADDFTGDVNKTFYLFKSGSWNNWNEHQQTIIDHETLDMDAVAPGQYIAIPALTAKDLDETKDLTMIAPMQGVYVQAGIETTSENPATIHLNYQKHVWNGFSKASQMNLPVRAPQMEDVEEKPDVTQDKQTRDSIIQVIEQSRAELTHRVRLVAYGEHSGADRIYVLEKPSYSAQYENGYDAPKVFAETEGVINLYVNEPEGGLLDVAATNNADSLFVGFNAGEDVNYELYITSVIGNDLELMDLQTGDRFALRDGASYEFAATPNSEDPYRFRIFKTETKPVVPTGWTGLGDKAKIWYNKQTLYISDAAANSTASIYTAAGELLKQITFNHNTTISTTDIPEGVYTVRVEDSVLKFFVKH